MIYFRTKCFIRKLISSIDGFNIKNEMFGFIKLTMNF